MQLEIFVYSNYLTKRVVNIITLFAAPKKKEDPDSAMGLKAKDDTLMSSKKLSLSLSIASMVNSEHLLLPFRINEKFPVVGDG